MKKLHTQKNHACCAVEIYQSQPNVLYSLDVAAHLACVPRRAVLIYCRAGLVRPVFLPPYEAMAFSEEAVYAIRRVERLRIVHGIEMAWIRRLFDLFDELERLRDELRFLRTV